MRGRGHHRPRQERRRHGAWPDRGRACRLPRAARCRRTERRRADARRTQAVVERSHSAANGQDGARRLHGRSPTERAEEVGKAVEASPRRRPPVPALIRGPRPMPALCPGADLLRLRLVGSSDTRYARSGDVYVAYRVFGEGPFDLVFASGMDFPSVEFHDHAAGSDFGELTDRMRVIRFDKRGTGASDRVSGVPSLEERMDDVRAVMDAVGVERAALLGHVDGAAMAILFAATYPDRVFALVLFQGKPRFVRAPDFPWAPTREEYEQGTQSWLAELLDSTRLERAFATRLQKPVTDPAVRERTRATRLTISPGSLVALRRMNMDIDVRG